MKGLSGLVILAVVVVIGLILLFFFLPAIISVLAKLPIIGNVLTGSNPEVGRTSAQDIKAQTSSESKSVVDTIVSIIFPTAGDKDDLLQARNLMKASSESQYSRGESISVSKKSFSLKTMQAVPYEINGWNSGERISLSLEVENTGNVPLNVTAWFNCTSPRSPVDVCSAAGVSFSCTPDGVGELCPVNGEECLYYNGLLSGSKQGLVCSSVEIGTNPEPEKSGSVDIYYGPSTSYDKAGVPHSWCETIISHGGSSGFFDIALNGYGVAELAHRARVEIPVMNEELASALIVSKRMQYSTPKTVNSEDPLIVGIDVGQTPKILRPRTNIDQPINQPVLISFSSAAENVENIKAVFIKFSKELLPKNWDELNPNWECKPSKVKGEANRLKSVLVGNYDVIDDYLDGSEVYNHFSACYYKNPNNFNTKKESFTITLPERVVHGEDTFLFGLDMVYDYRKVIGPLLLKVDCSGDTYKAMHGSDTMLVDLSTSLWEELRGLINLGGSCFTYNFTSKTRVFGKGCSWGAGG